MEDLLEEVVLQGILDLHIGIFVIEMIEDLKADQEDGDPHHDEEIDQEGRIIFLFQRADHEAEQEGEGYGRDP